MASGSLSFTPHQDDGSHSDGRDAGQLVWPYQGIRYDPFLGRPAQPPLPTPLGATLSVHEAIRFQLPPPMPPGYADMQPQRSGYLLHDALRGYDVQIPGSVRPRCGRFSDGLIRRHILSFQHGHLPYLGQPVDVRMNPYGHTQHPIPPLHHLPLPRPPTQVYPMMRSYAPAERSICPVEREAYLAKLQELQQYVPSLVRALSQLSRGRMDERGRESFRKLQFILRVLQDKTTRVSLSSLMTYEFAIKKICASRLAQTERASKRTLDLENRALPDAKHVRLEAPVGSEAGGSTGNTSAPCPDLIEESLLCGICQDIMHDCVCLQPCLHSYCSGCYSMWMVKSDLCPICRTRARRIGKHHILNSIVESYLAMHPEKRRKADDLNVLDKQNKIIHDMLWDDSEDVWSDLDSSLEEDDSHHDESGDEQS